MKFFSQRDEDWKNKKRYHALSADSLGELDLAINESIASPKNSRKKVKAWKAYGTFGAGLSDLLENGLDEKSEKGYSIFDYGCWDCTIAMIVAQLGGKFFEEDAKIDLEANPENFVRALRSWQILSLMGFSHDIYTDPVSILTKSRIQMALHEDYGEKGVSLKDATVLKYAIDKLSANRDSIGIAICVEGHPALGKKEDTHWVCVHPDSSSTTAAEILVGDPDNEEDIGFTSNTYEKFYEVCVYATKDGVRNLLNSV